MPDPIAKTAQEVMSGKNPLTDTRRAKFEEMGEETVIIAMGTAPYRLIGNGLVQAAAQMWLKEKREAREAVDAQARSLTRWSHIVGIVSGVLQAISITALIIGGGVIALFLYLFTLLF